MRPNWLVVASCSLCLCASPLAGNFQQVDHAAAAKRGAASSERWTPALSMRYRGVQATAISPDGERVAFVVREPHMTESKSEYRSHVWVAAADGSGATQFTRGAKSASNPSFSPDGRWLAFVSSRPAAAGDSSSDKKAKPQVWVLPMAGGEAKAVTDASSGVSSYRWSPDGKRIAYLMRDPETAEDKKRKKEKRDVILVDQNFKYGHLYLVEFSWDLDTIPRSVRLTAGEYHVTGFTWSPDSRKIVFDHQVDPRTDTRMTDGDISVVTLPTGSQESTAASASATKKNEKGEGSDKAFGKVVSLVRGAGTDGSAHWSPDGKLIAYVSSGDAPQPVGLGDLYVVEASGGQPRRLALTPNRRASITAWSRDSRHIYLNESLGTRRHILAVPVEGEDIRHISTGDAVVSSVSFARRADRMAFTRQSTEEPAEVYASSTAKYAPTKLTRIHEDVLLPKMGRTELLNWKAPDGTPVEGLLTLPVDYQRGKRYPLILDVHGGPAGVFSQTFTGAPGIYMLQYFAQEGFAILRPNPRGSTGYGKKFRFANVKDWGFGDLSDLLAGVDHVIDLGVGDAEKLLLMGWSYGGYMTSFAVTQTQRFKAASMGAGLPNLVSMVTTTDIGSYLAAHMDGEFWNDYERYEKHSAIYHIANVTTPTQVIHGANDLRVPFTQGQEFYRALQRRKVPTEMIVYPRTPHGPREPKFLMDVSERILTWFRKHLPEEGTESKDRRGR